MLREFRIPKQPSLALQLGLGTFDLEGSHWSIARVSLKRYRGIFNGHFSATARRFLNRAYTHQGAFYAVPWITLGFDRSAFDSVHKGTAAPFCSRRNAASGAEGAECQVNHQLRADCGRVQCLIKQYTPRCLARCPLDHPTSLLIIAYLRPRLDLVFVIRLFELRKSQCGRYAPQALKDRKRRFEGLGGLLNPVGNRMHSAAGAGAVSTCSSRASPPPSTASSLPRTKRLNGAGGCELLTSSGGLPSGGGGAQEWQYHSPSGTFRRRGRQQNVCCATSHPYPSQSNNLAAAFPLSHTAQTISWLTRVGPCGVCGAGCGYIWRTTLSAWRACTTEEPVFIIR